MAVRRARTKDEIVAAAWVLAREQGLTALSLRELGSRVGMRAQSLYSYFPSKHAIYDAMFRQGYEQYLALDPVEIDDAAGDAGVRRAALDGAVQFFDFCTSDPVRHQLLFQRVVPGFEPSTASYALALEAYERGVGKLRTHGITDGAGLDLFTAVITGLVDQQLSNDPGGTRWRRLLEPAVDMLLDHITRRTIPS